MTWSREDLRKWSRPEGVLLTEENARLSEWLELYRQQLQVVVQATGNAGGPTIVELFAARRRSQALWEFDRVTSSRSVIEGRKGKPIQLQREDMFEDSEVRDRANNLVLEELDGTLTLARVAGGAVEVNVIPFKASAAKKKKAAG